METASPDYQVVAHFEAFDLTLIWLCLKILISTVGDDQAVIFIEPAMFKCDKPSQEICDPVDEAICLIAAAIHDVDHPGKNRSL